MENNSKVDYSSSSITTDLFGTKEYTQSASTGIFASIFPPPASVLRKDSSSFGEKGFWSNQDSGNKKWSTKLEAPAPHIEEMSYDKHIEDKNSFYQEDRANPCHLSSSLHYGGRDVYSNSANNTTSGSYPIFKKDGGEEDPWINNSNDASRGNWWQGSLYY
ncbi:hypothetical protein ACFE04_013379 [Oxalis oulophora]